MQREAAARVLVLVCVGGVCVPGFGLTASVPSGSVAESAK